MIDAATMRTVSLWVLRVAWVSLPFTAGPLLADAIDGGADAVELVGTVGLWALWGVGVVALLLPHVLSLTALRILAPMALLATVAAAIAEGGVTKPVVAISVAAVCAVIALTAPIGDLFVNGSSYGDERRMPLRPPVPLLLGPVPLAWAVLAVPALFAPLLLADQRWISGGVVAAVGLALGWPALRALHRLGTRWVVFVPAGMVLVDHMTLTDPVLFRRNGVTRLSPALAGTEATDLSAGANGLVLQLTLSAETPLTLTAALTGATDGVARAQPVEALLFTPSQPGQVLAEAELRRIPVG